jgi:hypothetical protein
MISTPRTNKIGLLGAWRKPSLHLFTKILALLVGTTFLWPSVSWAFATNAYPLPKNIILFENQTVEIPDQVAVSLYKHQGTKGLVIHIQDLHCNYEAQTNIAKLIQHLAEHNQLRLVGIEGASLAVNTTHLSLYPDDNVKQSLGKFFMKQGKLSGAEFYASTSQRPVLLNGIENSALYGASRELVTRFLNDENQGYVSDLRESLNELKSKIYSRTLLKVDEENQAYRSGSVIPIAYYTYLLKQAQRLHLDGRAFPLVAGAVADPKTVLQNFRSDELNQEADRLEHAIRAVLYATPEEKALDTYLHRVDILEKLINISVSQEELAEYRSDPAGFSVKTIAAFVDQHQGSMNSEIFGLDQSIKLVMEFYALADARSQAFVENITRQMQNTKTGIAVMVTGGFHTQRVLEDLAAKDMAYVSVQPRLLHQDLVNPYFDLIRNRKTPLEKLLAKNQNIFALPPESAQTQEANRTVALSPELEAMQSPTSRLFFKEIGVLGPEVDAAFGYRAQAGLLLQNKLAEALRAIQARLQGHFNNYAYVHNVLTNPNDMRLLSNMGVLLPYPKLSMSAAVLSGNRLEQIERSGVIAELGKLDIEDTSLGIGNYRQNQVTLVTQQLNQLDHTGMKTMMARLWMFLKTFSFLTAVVLLIPHCGGDQVAPGSNNGTGGADAGLIAGTGGKSLGGTGGTSSKGTGGAGGKIDTSAGGNEAGVGGKTDLGSGGKTDTSSGGNEAGAGGKTDLGSGGKTDTSAGGSEAGAGGKTNLGSGGTDTSAGGSEAGMGGKTDTGAGGSQAGAGGTTAGTGVTTAGTGGADAATGGADSSTGGTDAGPATVYCNDNGYEVALAADKITWVITFPDGSETKTVQGVAPGVNEPNKELFNQDGIRVVLMNDQVQYIITGKNSQGYTQVRTITQSLTNHTTTDVVDDMNVYGKHSFTITVSFVNAPGINGGLIAYRAKLQLINGNWMGTFVHADGSAYTDADGGVVAPQVLGVAGQADSSEILTLANGLGIGPDTVTIQTPTKYPNVTSVSYVQEGYLEVFETTDPGTQAHQIIIDYNGASIPLHEGVALGSVVTWYPDDPIGQTGKAIALNADGSVKVTEPVVNNQGMIYLVTTSGFTVKQTITGTTKTMSAVIEDAGGLAKEIGDVVMATTSAGTVTYHTPNSTVADSTAPVSYNAIGGSYGFNYVTASQTWKIVVVVKTTGEVSSATYTPASLGYWVMKVIQKYWAPSLSDRTVKAVGLAWGVFEAVGLGLSLALVPLAAMPLMALAFYGVLILAHLPLMAADGLRGRTLARAFTGQALILLGYGALSVLGLRPWLAAMSAVHILKDLPKKAIGQTRRTVTESQRSIRSGLRSRQLLAFSLLAALVLAGCGKGNSPVGPGPEPNSTYYTEANRMTIELEENGATWDITFTDATGTYVVTPSEIKSTDQVIYNNHGSQMTLTAAGQVILTTSGTNSKGVAGIETTTVGLTGDRTGTDMVVTKDSNGKQAAEITLYFENANGNSAYNAKLENSAGQEIAAFSNGTSTNVAVTGNANSSKTMTVTNTLGTGPATFTVTTPVEYDNVQKELAAQDGTLDVYVLNTTGEYIIDSNDGVAMHHDTVTPPASGTQVVYNINGTLLELNQTSVLFEQVTAAGTTVSIVTPSGMTAKETKVGATKTFSVQIEDAGGVVKAIGDVVMTTTNAGVANFHAPGSSTIDFTATVNYNAIGGTYSFSYTDSSGKIWNIGMAIDGTGLLSGASFTPASLGYWIMKAIQRHWAPSLSDKTVKGVGLVWGVLEAVGLGLTLALVPLVSLPVIALALYGVLILAHLPLMVASGLRGRALARAFAGQAAVLMGYGALSMLGLRPWLAALALVHIWKDIPKNIATQTRHSFTDSRRTIGSNLSLRRTVFVFSVLAALVLAGCGKESPTGPGGPAIEPNTTYFTVTDRMTIGLEADGRTWDITFTDATGKHTATPAAIKSADQDLYNENGSKVTLTSNSQVILTIPRANSAGVTGTETLTVALTGDHTGKDLVVTTDGNNRKNSEITLYYMNADGTDAYNAKLANIGGQEIATFTNATGELGKTVVTETGNANSSKNMTVNNTFGIGPAAETVTTPVEYDNVQTEMMAEDGTLDVYVTTTGQYVFDYLEGAIPTHDIVTPNGSTQIINSGTNGTLLEITPDKSVLFSKTTTTGTRTSLVTLQNIMITENATSTSKTLAVTVLDAGGVAKGVADIVMTSANQGQAQFHAPGSNVIYDSPTVTYDPFIGTYSFSYDNPTDGKGSVTINVNQQGDLVTGSATKTTYYTESGRMTIEQNPAAQTWKITFLDALNQQQTKIAGITGSDQVLFDDYAQTKLTLTAAGQVILTSPGKNAAGINGIETTTVSLTGDRTGTDVVVTTDGNGKNSAQYTFYYENTDGTPAYQGRLQNVAGQLVAVFTNTTGELGRTNVARTGNANSSKTLTVSNTFGTGATSSTVTTPVEYNAVQSELVAQDGTLDVYVNTSGQYIIDSYDGATAHHDVVTPDATTQIIYDSSNNGAQAGTLLEVDKSSVLFEQVTAGGTTISLVTPSGMTAKETIVGTTKTFSAEVEDAGGVVKAIGDVVMSTTSQGVANFHAPGSSTIDFTAIVKYDPIGGNYSFSYTDASGKIWNIGMVIGKTGNLSGASYTPASLGYWVMKVIQKYWAPSLSDRTVKGVGAAWGILEAVGLGLTLALVPLVSIPVLATVFYGLVITLHLPLMVASGLRGKVLAKAFLGQAAVLLGYGALSAMGLPTWSRTLSGGSLAALHIGKDTLEVLSRATPAQAVRSATPRDLSGAIKAGEEPYDSRHPLIKLLQSHPEIFRNHFEKLIFRTGETFGMDYGPLSEGKLKATQLNADNTGIVVTLPYEHAVLMNARPAAWNLLTRFQVWRHARQAMPGMLQALNLFSAENVRVATEQAAAMREEMAGQDADSVMYLKLEALRAQGDMQNQEFLQAKKGGHKAIAGVELFKFLEACQQKLRPQADTLYGLIEAQGQFRSERRGGERRRSSLLAQALLDLSLLKIADPILRKEIEGLQVRLQVAKAESLKLAKTSMLQQNEIDPYSLEVGRVAELIEVSRNPNLAAAVSQPIAGVKAGEPNLDQVHLMLDAVSKKAMLAAVAGLLKVKDMAPGLRSNLEAFQAVMNKDKMTPADGAVLQQLLQSVSIQGENLMATAVGPEIANYVMATGNGRIMVRQIVADGIRMNVAEPVLFDLLADSVDVDIAKSTKPLAVIPFHGKMPTILPSQGNFTGQVEAYLKTATFFKDHLSPRSALAQAFYGHQRENTTKSNEQLARVAITIIREAEQELDKGLISLSEYEANLQAVQNLFAHSAVFKPMQLGTFDDGTVALVPDSLSDGGQLAFAGLCERQKQRGGFELTPARDRALSQHKMLFLRIGASA